MNKAFVKKLVNFKESLNKIATKEDKLIVALSGGPDSVFLLENLIRIGYKNLLLAHVNYKLRRKESDKDQAFVEKIAKRLNLPLKKKICNIKNSKNNIEEAARDKRYQFFKQIMEDTKAKYILTAHTKDDQVETILMNFIRGSSVTGLTGIHTLDNHIYRPLLDFTKNEIITYLNKNKISYRIDESNFDISYTRNNLRHIIIPLIKTLNVSFDETIVRNLKINTSIDAFLIEKANSWIKRNYKNNEISIKAFLKLHIALKRQVLRTVIKINLKTLKDISFDQIEEIRLLIENNRTGKSKIIDKGLKFTTNYGKILVSSNTKSRKVQTSRISKKLTIPGSIKIDKYSINTSIVRSKGNEKNIAYLDFKKLPNTLLVRYPVPGDRFQPLGMSNTKKLHDFFTDIKLSSIKRKNTPIIVTEDGKIVWVSGFRIDHKYRVDPSTKSILKVSINQ